VQSARSGLPTSKIMPESNREKLWKLSHDMIGSLIDCVMKLQTWDDKTVYLCSQLHLMAIISGSMKVTGNTINIAGVLKSRILIDCVVNTIAGLNEGPATVKGVSVPSFVEAELKKLSLPLKDRKQRRGHHHTQFQNHAPDTWKHTKEPEGMSVKHIGNSMIHADADAGYHVRFFDLLGSDIKSLSLAVTIFVQETNGYLESIGAGLPQKVYDDYMDELRALLPQVLAEKASYKGDFSPFEERLYNELSKHNSNVGIVKK
jgi:hypothetical protein